MMNKEPCKVSSNHWDLVGGCLNIYLLLHLGHITYHNTVFFSWCESDSISFIIIFSLCKVHVGTIINYFGRYIVTLSWWNGDMFLFQFFFY